MSNNPEHYPAAARAADALDQKRMNETPAHHCSGSDCVTCSWRPSDLDEVSSIIERELSLAGIVLLLQKLQSLRTESSSRISGTGRAQAPVDEGSLETIPVPVALFEEARLLLERVAGEQFEIKKLQQSKARSFTLRPLLLPAEAHMSCAKCSYGALMAKEEGGIATCLCYLHVVELVLEKEVRARTE